MSHNTRNVLEANVLIPHKFAERLPGTGRCSWPVFLPSWDIHPGGPRAADEGPGGLVRPKPAAAAGEARPGGAPGVGPVAPHTGRPEEDTPGWDPRELRTCLSGQSPGEEDPEGDRGRRGAAHRALRGPGFQS